MKVNILKFEIVCMQQTFILSHSITENKAIWNIKVVVSKVIVIIKLLTSKEVRQPPIPYDWDVALYANGALHETHFLST